MAKSNVFRVSQSKVNVYRKCKYAYHLRYVEKIRKRVKARPLQFGSLVHTMLEADANGTNPYKALTTAVTGQKLFASEREELEQVAQDARFIMRDYFEYWENAPDDKVLNYIKRKKKSAEHQIFVEIMPGVELEVRIDALAENKRGMWLVEHKTFKQMPSDDHRWRSLQSTIYKKVVDIMKIKVDGMAWDYIRSKPPTMPQFLKDGTISKKRIDTLPSAVKALAAQSKKLVPQRIYEAAQENRKNYFSRVFTAFRAKTVELVWNDFLETVKEMRANHGMFKAKTIDRHCDWCDYEGICRAELTGGDRNFVIKKEYTTREQREEIEIQQAD